jgi:hypothetical protein
MRVRIARYGSSVATRCVSRSSTILQAPT